MKKPTLRVFLRMQHGEVLADPGVSLYLEGLIREWAGSAKPGEGNLPGVSAGAFAAWLDAWWGAFTEESETPVEDVLKGAVAEWCGGRSF